MITLLIFLIFSGSFFLYNTSKVAILSPHFQIEKWMQQHNKTSNSIGLFLLVFCLASTIFLFGLGVGIFIWTLLLMIIQGTLIILSPIKAFNYKHGIALLLLILVLELLFI
ncbi:hypothetical protein [Aquimarina aquimarini]|uniref:hypothetical protein n=1 Tax=Aquimarina aquimarini TaxID=1191734 RepID=UPI000D54B8B1|nr:hypothetical protein [Aquimarina aquimarini]